MIMIYWEGFCFGGMVCNWPAGGHLEKLEFLTAQNHAVPVLMQPLVL